MGLIDHLREGNLTGILETIIAVAIALTVHEYAHAKVADWAGDPTPRSQGRVTLNPLAHYDPLGTTLILLFGFGWGKPVPVNPLKFRRPRRDDVLVSAAGAGANLLTAVLFGLLLRFRVVPAPYQELVFFIVALNVVLALFNLIPLYPLDGSHILVGLLPYRQAHKINLFYQRWGMIPLMILFLALSFSPLLQVPLLLILQLITGGGMRG